MSRRNGIAIAQSRGRRSCRVQMADGHRKGLGKCVRVITKIFFSFLLYRITDYAGGGDGVVCRRGSNNGAGFYSRFPRSSISSVERGWRGRGFRDENRRSIPVINVSRVADDDGSMNSGRVYYCVSCTRAMPRLQMRCNMCTPPFPWCVHNITYSFRVPRILISLFFHQYDPTSRPNNNIYIYESWYLCAKIIARRHRQSTMIINALVADL